MWRIIRRVRGPFRSALSERYDNRPLIFVFGAMRDKAISEMTEILFPLAERVIATRPENPRAASPEEIQQAASAWEQRLSRLLKWGSSGAGSRGGARGGFVVHGSINLVWRSDAVARRGALERLFAARLKARFEQGLFRYA